MSEKMKSIHKAYCDYEVAKANNRRVLAVKEEKRIKGIITSHVSKATLATQLLALY